MCWATTPARSTATRMCPSSAPPRSASTASSWAPATVSDTWFRASRGLTPGRPGPRLISANPTTCPNSGESIDEFDPRHSGAPPGELRPGEPGAHPLGLRAGCRHVHAEGDPHGARSHASHLPGADRRVRETGLRVHHGEPFRRGRLRLHLLD